MDERELKKEYVTYLRDNKLEHLDCEMLFEMIKYFEGLGKDKYDKALERARRILCNVPEGSASARDIETIFPDLRESEDERIRKELMKFLQNITFITDDDGKVEKVFYADTTIQKVEKWISWLEKQKENPKSADSISSDCMSNVRCEDRWHKVTDSLPDNGRLVLAKDCLGNVLLARYDGENWEVNVYDNEDHYCHNSISKWCEIPSEKQKEQKPAEWSEEDERIIDTIVSVLGQYIDYKTVSGTSSGYATPRYNKEIDWLKSLRPQPKQEWSEEDRDMIAQYLHDRDGGMLWSKATEITSDILDMLRPRPSWKPSEEQMEALQRAIDACESEWAYQDDELRSLLNDLKKL